MTSSGMRQQLLLAVMIGAVVGALSGLVESVVWIVRISWWPVDTTPIPIAMVIYGSINALMTGLWGLAARRMGQRPFQVRTLLFSLLAMTYLFGGFYVNRLWFPEISTWPSLLFTAAWTAAWLVAVTVLLKIRPRATASLPGGTWMPGARMMLVLLAVIAGLLVIPAHVWRRFHPSAVRHAIRDPERPNLLLIVMDTTRADHLSCYGYPRKTTPNLDLLAEEGVLFEQAYTPAPWTVPSHASLFTGLYPSQHGADWGHERLDDRLMTLAELLRDHGYQTVGFSNNPWISRSTNFHQGFGYFEQTWLGGQLINRFAIVRIMEKLVELTLQNRDDDADLTNRDIRRWFHRVYDPIRPFFLFINYIEPHFTYEPPEPYRSRFLQSAHQAAARALNLKGFRHLAPPVRFDQTTRAVLNDLYDGEIAYLDAKIGELVEELRDHQLLDHTLLIITSDHGENVGDHQLFEHQFCVYETLLHVPLILRYPAALPAKTRVAEPVSLVDVMPTLIKLLSLEAQTLQAALPGQSWVGSTLAVPRERVILAEYAAPIPQLKKYQEKRQVVDARYFTRNLKSLRTGTLKFIWDSDGRHELYDLSQDPKELQDLVQELPEQAKAMEAELHQRLLALESLGAPEPGAELDETTREKLRALGYLH